MTPLNSDGNFSYNTLFLFDFLPKFLLSPYNIFFSTKIILKSFIGRRKLGNVGSFGSSMMNIFMIHGSIRECVCLLWA